MNPEIAPFHAINISRLAHELTAQGRDVIHMEFGQPSTGAPRAAIEVAHRVLDTDGMGYWESPLLRERLARRYAETYGVDIAPERFVITCGASPALVLALSSLFAPGERIAMARPGYVAYRNVTRALHLEPVEIPCGPEVRFQLTAQALEALDPAPAGVILASPANPTGTIIEADELQKIAEVCARRNIRIVSDEIYHGLSYGEPARSMLEFDPQATVISSFSKYFSMVGWRLGWMIAPETHVHRARAYLGNLFLTAPSLSQHAAVAALDDPAAKAELDGHVATYARNRDLLLAALPQMGLARLAPPDGAFYLYVDVGHLTDDSLAFCKRMLEETGVATAPGVDFDPDLGRRFIRFSFAVSTAEVEEAVRRLTGWLGGGGAPRRARRQHPDGYPCGFGANPLLRLLRVDVSRLGVRSVTTSLTTNGEVFSFTVASGWRLKRNRDGFGYLCRCKAARSDRSSTELACASRCA